MKIKFLLPACASLILALGSCKKDSTDTREDGEITTTFELAGDQAISDNLTQDANDVLNEAAVDYNFAGSGFTGGSAQTSNTLSCATVTVTAAPGTIFPKNIVIDFGSGCTSQNLVTRSGKILVTLTDSLRKSGSVATMNFDNYYVRGFKKEGTITWTNTSTASVRSWHRVCQNGKITAPSGNYWTHFGTQDIVQTAGTSTPIILMDDVFLVTGGHTVTNAAGKTRTGTILTALQKKTNCTNIDQGTYQLQGPNHVAVIDYGNGVCDADATISIDGQTPHQITLN